MGLEHVAALSHLQEQNGRSASIIYFGGKLDDELCKDIGRALRTNTTTATLIIHGWGATTEGITSIFEGVRGNKTLKRLDVQKGGSSNGITSSYLFACLLENSSIQSLKLRGIFPPPTLDDACVKLFFSYRAPRYRHLDIGISNVLCLGYIFDDSQPVMTVPAVAPLITSLDLSKCGIDSWSISCMNLQSSNLRCLETLRLDGNNLRNGLKELVRQATGHSTLANIFLNDTSVPDADGVLLASLLDTNPALKTLSLVGNELSDPAALSFAEGMKKSATFSSLNLWRNKIESTGVRALLETLASKDSIAYLNLGDNCPDFELHHELRSVAELNRRLDYSNLYIDELYDVFMALKTSQPASINLSHKALDFPYMCAVPSALFRDIPFKTLMMKGCSISALECAAFAKRVLEAPSMSLQTLNLMSNNLRDSGCKFIADIITENKTIKSLNLSNNKFGNQGLDSIGNALRTNTTLETLFLQKNSFSAYGCDKFAMSLALNTTLQILHMEESFINMIFEEDLPFGTTDSDLRLFFQQRMLLNSSLKGLYIFSANSIHLPSYIGQRITSQSYHWYRKAHVEMPVLVPRPTRDACRGLFMLVCCLRQGLATPTTAVATTHTGKGRARASKAPAVVMTPGLPVEIAEIILGYITMLQLDTLGKTLKKSLKAKKKK